MFKIKSIARIQKSEEYGRRLVFTHNALNPRDKLGKFGITFYETYLAGKSIEVEIKIKKDNIEKVKKLYLNRNSLCKYLNALDGTPSRVFANDQEIMDRLNDSFWDGDLNSKDPAADIAKKQSDAGESKMRHVGEHNKRKISGWFRALSESFVGRIFSWFYKKTVQSVNALKLRFFLFNKEKSYFEKSEILANNRFREAKARVPAYKKHVKDFVIKDDTKFSDIPPLTKDIYIKPTAKTPWETHVDGKMPRHFKVDTSTGTTGSPTIWYRSDEEIKPVKDALVSISRIVMGSRDFLTVNTFALGPWATGLSVHEMSREYGSIFSPGADPEKVFAIIDTQYRYEQSRMSDAIDELLKKLKVAESLKKTIKADLIEMSNQILTALLKDPQLTVAAAIKNEKNRIKLDASIPEDKKNIALNSLRCLSDNIQIIERLNAEKKLMMVTGYPPFVLELTRYAKNHNIDMRKYNLTAVVGGQGMSETMRMEIENNGFMNVYSSFGASDLDINIGFESDFEIELRRTIEKNPGLARELYGANKGTPMLFRYDPLNYHIECDKQHSDHLVMTCNRDNRTSPRVRYDIQDQGRVYAASDIQALLTKYGIFSEKLKMRHNLPFLFVWGRDSTAGYGTVNVPFDQLESAVQKLDTEKLILKKAFFSYEQDHKSRFDIWLELNDGVEFPLDEEIKKIHADTIKEMALANEYFAEEIKHLADDKLLPAIVFFKRGKSPIADPNGQRKQVLVFKQGANFDGKFEFPADKVETQLTKGEYDRIISQDQGLRVEM